MIEERLSRWQHYRRLQVLSREFVYTGHRVKPHDRNKLDTVFKLSPQLYALESSHAAVLEQLRAAPDARAKLALVARLTRDVYSAGETEFELLRGAGSVAPELAEVSATVERRRRQQQERLIELLRQQGALRADRTDEEAIDELWALTSFDLYRLLVLQSGWTPEHFELWLGEALAERLLAR